MSQCGLSTGGQQTDRWDAVGPVECNMATVEGFTAERLCAINGRSDVTDGTQSPTNREELGAEKRQGTEQHEGDERRMKNDSRGEELDHRANSKGQEKSNATQERSMASHPNSRRGTLRALMPRPWRVMAQTKNWVQEVRGSGRGV
ncbi:hypothetical protein NDU88_001967 [Pleurodeles waltl]|uniref:Uncharacterized protein n=1 Tax=Pleurodeles waltl TaxID=8319 RepID=A0AAV7W0G5_PLEWA|nr:hypothetical protein NDU88_001967 [Pleurodeles waltl]